MHLIIAGGGSIGAKLAELFVKEKHDVVVVEKERKNAEDLGEKLDALVLHGDASESKILKDGGIENCNAIVAITGDDKTNLMICEIAKSFNVPTIVARVNESPNEPIFMKLGITANINTTVSSVMAFKRALEKSEKRLVDLVAGDKAVIMERIVPRKCGVVNKRVRQVTSNFVIAAIYRKGDLVRPKSDTEILEEDVLTICVPVDDVKAVDAMFRA
jgi:trk system potassium uptake protein TrkA